MKKKSCLLLLSFTLMSNTFANTEVAKIKNQLCESTKEYITVYRYLNDQKAFDLKKNEIMKIADATSKGCSGAAKRFIEVNELLVKATVLTSDSIKIALKFTDKSSQATETFITLFKESFLKDYLDLEIKTAIDFSLKLALEADGDSEMIKNDFQKVVRFCLDQKNLDLSGPKCSDLASKVALVGANLKMEISPTFLAHFTYITGKENVDLPTYKALELSLKLITAGPLSVQNFSDAYKFAISKNGLDLGKQGAINYAELMALRSKI